MAEATQQAAVVSVRDVTPSVRELVLSPLEQAIHFRPGQWVSLKLPVGQRPPLVRAYSMAEPETASGHLALVFDRVPQGLGSNYLYTLKAGDRVVLSGPYGNFAAPDPLPKDLVLIGRFTGIVPLRCILRRLFAQPPSHRVTLLYQVPDRAELLYHDEFTDLAARHDRFCYEPMVSEADRREHSGAEYQPVLEKLAALLAGRTDFLPMICGTKAFVRPLRASLMERGFSRRDVSVETYD
ncbi:MAG: ferredoxin--NADP reductase [Nitrospiraceae bacterium]